jgi:TIR domain
MTDIMLAHAPDGDARAALIARKLGARGYKVRHAANGYFAPGPLGRRRLKADIDNAACVVVLWSREAAEAPALHAAAQQARAQGKLAFARLDAAAAPPGLRVAKAADLSNWMGRETGRAWRELDGAVRRLAKAPAPAKRPAARPAASAVRSATPAAAPEPAAAKKRGGAAGLIILLLAALAAAGGGAAYYYFYVLR